MVLVACLEAVACVAIVYLLLRGQQEAERAWARERSELLSRIQRPEQTPVTGVTLPPVPDYEPDEIDRVGAIEWAREEDDVDQVGSIAGE